MGRRITILGMGPSAYRRSLDIGKYVDGTEVWSLNNAYLTFPVLRERKGFGRMFELHGWDYLRTWSPGQTDSGEPIDHWLELDRLDCPVYVTEHIPRVRKQILYPHLEVFSRFKPYYLGSPSLMLALALFEHDCGNTIDYIQSWGIDTSDERHKQQRQSWAWWCSKCEERNIETGGSMLGFHTEPEKDAGLTGLREAVAELVRKRTSEEATKEAKADPAPDSSA